jgi:hypothetical protein
MFIKNKTELLNKSIEITVYKSNTLRYPKVYYFNPPPNIVRIINTLKITVFMLQSLVAIPTNIIVCS